MANDGDKYDNVNALGFFQAFLGILSILIGAGELMVVVLVGSFELGISPCFRPYMLGAGIWAGIFFMIGGFLAFILRGDKMEDRRLGAAQTMSWLNTIVSAPALIGISVAGCVQSNIDWANFDGFDLDPSDGDGYVGLGYYRDLVGLQGTLAAIGIVELIISIAIVCCLWNQQGTNQILKEFQNAVSSGAGIVQFLIGGILAISIDETKTERRMGAVLTMCWLNTIIFAPALIFISIAGCIQNNIDEPPLSQRSRYTTLRAMEACLIIAGLFELGNSLLLLWIYHDDMFATNQVAPTPATSRSPTVPAPAMPKSVSSHDVIRRPEPTPNADEPSTPLPSAAPTPPPAGLDVQYARRDIP